MSRAEVEARYAYLKVSGVCGKDSRCAKIEAALANVNVKDNAFYVSQAGTDDPSYQWSSAIDRNLSYTLSVNSHIPDGETPEVIPVNWVQPERTEVTFTQNSRASEADVRAAIALIQDETGDRAEALAVFEEQLVQGLAVYRSLSDGEASTDGKDPVFQFTSLTDPDKSYSITENSALPDGVEATWSIATRVRKSDVAQYIADALFVGDANDPKLLAAQAALGDTFDDGFTMVQAGTNDNIQYQWMSKTNPNLSYSITTEPAWNETTFTGTRRVSQEDAAKVYQYLKNADSADSRFGNLNAAFDDGELFYLSQVGVDDPSYSWSSRANRNISYAMSLNSKVPVGIPETYKVPPEVTFTKSERVSIGEARTQAEQYLYNALDKEEALAALKPGVAVTKVLTDGEEGSDFIDPVYQFVDVADPDTSYSLAFRSGLPVKNALVDKAVEASWSVTTRVSRADVLHYIEAEDGKEWITDPAKKADALAAWADGEAFYRTQTRSNGLEGATLSYQYQWTSRVNPNVSYGLTVKTGTDLADANILWHESTFTRTQRVSRETVAAEYAYLNDPADPRYHADDTRYANLQEALRWGAVFYMSQAGADDPTYQWTHRSDRNISYSLSKNTKVPCGTAAEPCGTADAPTRFKTEVTFSKSTRVAISEAAGQALNVGDTSDLAEILGTDRIFDPTKTDGQLGVLEQGGVIVSKTLTDGEDVLDFIDPTYQFTDVSDPDKSYSISIKSGIPVGLRNDQNQYTQFTTEATWGVTRRISRDQVLQHIETDTMGTEASGDDKEWIVDTQKKDDALDALEQGDVFYMSYGGTNDNINYQWTDRSDPNVSYSLSVKDKANPVTGINWHETTFAKNRRVSEEEVRLELSRLASEDSRHAMLSDALDDGRIFYMSQAGNDLPSFSWASATNRNLNYSVSQSRFNGQIELTVTKSERVSLAESVQAASRIRDESDAGEASDALATGGVTVFRTVSDGESPHDGNEANPTYQFTDVNNPDRNYSMNINSDAPDGIEATWNISERISRDQALEAIGWIVDEAKRAQALTAIAGADMIQMTRGGEDDTPTYQWTNRAEDAVSYSLQVEADWQQAVFNRNERVDDATVAGIVGAITEAYTLRRNGMLGERDALASEDPQRAVLDGALQALESEYLGQKSKVEAALAKGSIFYRAQSGADDPTYQWTNDKDPNTNYTVSVNTHVPVGAEREDGTYARYRTEYNFSESVRISRGALESSILDGTTPAGLIADEAQREQALAALADPGAMFYRNTVNSEESTYQWSSSYNSRVSYSVSIDPNVPIGEGGTAGYATVAKFTRTERVSRAVMQSLLLQIASKAQTGADESEEHRNARLAIAEGESFTMSQSGSDDKTYSGQVFPIRQ